MEKLFLFFIFVVFGSVILRPAAAQITLPAAMPSAQQGSTGEDRKAASRYGHVLGHEWGGHTGDWAQYSFHTGSIAPPAYLHLRYAREIAGTSHLRATLDGIDRGTLALPSTGGWGDREDQFQVATLKLGALRTGDHTLRLTVELPLKAKLRLQPPVPALDLVGNRTDKSSVGHGVNVALYTGACAFARDKAAAQNLGIIPRYLTNPKEYWTQFPVPALSQTDPEFDPEHRYWAGLTWPATNSHVLEGFANTAKRLDRSQMPAAAELFHRMVALHLKPRADFYEHYHPLTGQPLSGFRDYMHSWWIDTILRHVAGMEVQDDGSLIVDALPMGVTFYALKGAPYRGHKIDLLWNDASAGKGLVVRCDGRVVRRALTWKPGDTPIKIEAAALGMK